jgi:hypothetical protein
MECPPGRHVVVSDAVRVERGQQRQPDPRALAARAGLLGRSDETPAGEIALQDRDRGVRADRGEIAYNAKS